MSSMTNIKLIKPFRLEEFPDEILLEIFKYMKPIDLHNFVGLNKRMTNVVHDVRLSIVIEYPEYEDEDLNYLLSFQPKKFVYLKMLCHWEAFQMNQFEELRSLTLDCNYLYGNQFEQLLTVTLPYLERFSIDEVPNVHAKELFQTICFTEHFPSLKLCRISGEFGSLLEYNTNDQLVNTTIRTLIVNKVYKSELNHIFHLLPNLHRFEASITKDLYSDSKNKNNSSNSNLYFHTSIEHLRLTFNDPYKDFENILLYGPNLKQLRITGKIQENSVLIYFEKLAKLFRSDARHLQKFDCELYFHAWDQQQADIHTIQQLHPLFKTIHCHQGPNINQCYATDLTEYPNYSEYSYVERINDWTTYEYNDIQNDYHDNNYYDQDSDDYYDRDDDNGWVDYGLGYRGNYKANYGSSPWSGNNDDD